MMILKSSKYPEGLSVLVVDKCLVEKDCFCAMIETSKNIVLITNEFAEYLKIEPNFEKALIEYTAIIEKTKEWNDADNKI